MASAREAKHSTLETRKCRFVCRLTITHFSIVAWQLANALRTNAYKIRRRRGWNPTASLPYRSCRSKSWLKIKNPAAPGVMRIGKHDESSTAVHSWVGGMMKIREVAFPCAIALTLGACGQAPQGPQGDPGPPGPVGPSGPPGPAAGVRLVRSACDATSCTVQCEADEVLVTAWCGAARNPTNFPTDRSAICRGRGAANSPLVGVCAKSTGP